MKRIVWLLIILGVSTIGLAVVATIVLAVKYSGSKNSLSQTITTTTTTPKSTPPTPSTITITTTTSQPPATTIVTAEEDSIHHDGTITEIELNTVDKAVTDIAQLYTDKKLEVFVENNVNGLEMLHRFAFTTTYRFSGQQLDNLNLEININLNISDNDFDEFVDTVVSFIKKPNFLTIRTRANKFIYRNYDNDLDEQVGLTMNYDSVPESIPNIPGHYNGTKWIVRIRDIAEINNQGGSAQKKLVNLNDERCSLFRFWVDNNFAVTTVSKFLEKHNHGTMKTLTLTYDIKRGSQIFFNKLYVSLKTELNSDHLKDWRLRVDFYSTLWSEDPVFGDNDTVPSIILERS